MSMFSRSIVLNGCVVMAGFLVMNAAAMMTSGLPYLMGAAVVLAAVLGALLMLRRWFFGEHFSRAAESIGLKKVAFRALVPGLLVAAALLLTYPLLSFALRTTIVLADNWLPHLAGLFFTGGIAEEALFRGALFGQLRQSMGFRQAAFASMFVFALVHLLLFTYLDWSIALMSTLLAVATSIPLAGLFERAGNAIWGAALVHATIRTIAMVFVSAQDNTSLALVWMLGCMIVPYLVLALLPGFRGMWKQGPAGSAPAFTDIHPTS